tara:strand:+ start:7736 stop:8611 length:876 start_codon:yes stop_codon:yes gene_type:complete
MAKKTRSKAKKSHRDPDRAARNRRTAIAVLLVVGGVASFVGASAGLDAINNRAITELTPGDPVVAIAWPRDERGQVWLPMLERERLSSLMLQAASGGRALSGEPLAEIGRALTDTGWFEGTPTVRWTAEGHIHAEGRFRAPAAAVRIGPREHLIDYQGRVLPLDYPAGASNQIFLLNPSQPIADVGSPWPGEDVRASLDLIVLLQRESLLEQVAGIDLGQGRQSGSLSIITDRGARVIWGGGPQHLRPAEQPTSVKLTRLRALLDRTGRIDASVDLVDLRPQQPLIERRHD